MVYKSVESKIPEVQKALSKIFIVKPFHVWKNVLDLDYISVIDEATVCMVVSKTDIGKEILKCFTDIDTENHKVPNISFNDKVLPVSCFNVEYLNKILVALQKFDMNDNRIKLTMGSGTPIIIENEHLKFILAPMVMEDW